MQNTDQKPWYKQFWPWFIMAIPACGVVAGITTVIIASNNAPQMSQSNIERFGRISEPARPVDKQRDNEQPAAE